MPKFRRTLFPGRWQEQAVEQGAHIASLLTPLRAEDNLSQETLVKKLRTNFFVCLPETVGGLWGSGGAHAFFLIFRACCSRYPQRQQRVRGGEGGKRELLPRAAPSRGPSRSRCRGLSPPG